MLDMEQDSDGEFVDEGFVKIKIFGVGGGGCNAVTRLREKIPGGVEFIAANTDVMALRKVVSKKYPITRLQLGKVKTKGQGAGAIPEVGREAARESSEDIKALLQGTNLLFITAGMGGGTGTGGAPVVAQIAKSMGILTIAVVTKPFHHEAAKKMKTAEEGIERLRKEVDVLVVVPNEKAFQCTDKNATLLDVMRTADEVLFNCIVGVTDIMLEHTYINLDFADIQTVLKNKGNAHIGIGRASGENRVIDALIAACSSEMMETSIEGATNLIVRVVVDYDLGKEEVNAALALLPQVVHPEAEIIHGLGFNQDFRDHVEITVIATGMKGGANNANNFYNSASNIGIEKERPVTPPPAPRKTDLFPRSSASKENPLQKDVNFDEANIPPYIRDIMRKNKKE